MQWIVIHSEHKVSGCFSRFLAPARYAHPETSISTAIGLCRQEGSPMSNIKPTDERSPVGSNWCRPRPCGESGHTVSCGTPVRMRVMNCRDHVRSVAMYPRRCYGPNRVSASGPGRLSPDPQVDSEKPTLLQRRAGFRDPTSPDNYEGRNQPTAVNQPCLSSSSPLVIPKNARCSASVIGPRRPAPICTPSTERIGVISAAVPVKKSSSAM